MARPKKEKEEKPWKDVVSNCSKCRYFGISKRFLKAPEYRCLAMGCIETCFSFGMELCKKNYEEK